MSKIVFGEVDWNSGDTGAPKSDFMRLRIGIGHPGNKVDVTNWVLGKFKSNEKGPIQEAFFKFNNVIELLSNNEILDAQSKLHSE